MSEIKEFMLYIAAALIFYFIVVFPIRKWNCERVGMTAEYFIEGCVIKGE